MRGTRKLTKRDMLWNDLCPDITVDPETFDVFVDGARGPVFEEQAKDLREVRRHRAPHVHGAGGSAVRLRLPQAATRSPRLVEACLRLAAPKAMRGAARRVPYQEGRLRGVQTTKIFPRR